MSHIDGRFVGHELRVVDLDAATGFYGGLFGWTAEEYPMGRLLRSGGAVIGGMSPKIEGVPSHWTPLIGADDVDTVADAATAAGGIVTTGRPVDVAGQGRIAPILDSHKTIFASMRPENTPPSPAGREPGAFVWARLRTTDVAASAEFYRRAIGWRPTVAPDGDAAVFDHPDGDRVAEVKAAGDGEPTGWLAFVHVTDLGASRARAVELGGTVHGGRVDIPGVGAMAVIRDAEGAELALFQPA